MPMDIIFKFAIRENLLKLNVGFAPKMNGYILTKNLIKYKNKISKFLEQSSHEEKSRKGSSLGLIYL